MTLLPSSTESWIKTLVALVISSAANAVLGSLGAAAVGTPLNWKQIGAVAGTGGFVAALTYLQKSPLPTDTTKT